MKLKTLMKKIEGKYPLNLAYDWDNVGLIVGNPEMEINKILVTLEANESVVREAIEKKVDLIITHHPFIFGKMNKINSTDLKGKLIYELIKNDISIYSMHTNFDIASEGLNDYFMDLLEVKNTKILDVTSSETLYKLAVYVPVDHSSKVREALAKAGAGHIGNYSSCSFSTEGTGRFKPLEGTNPFIGEVNQLEGVQEIKIETIVPQRILGGTINAMISSHPYEEVAYDLYKLENKGEKSGLGRIGNLDKELSLEELCKLIKSKLNSNSIRVVGDLNKGIKKIAVVTGSGADMIKKAQRQGADVLITGDLKYHEAQDCLDINMCALDCGHFETEDIFKDSIKKFLDSEVDVETIKSEVNLNPFQII